MSHRIWWLICVFAFALGAAIEFDRPATEPQATSAVRSGQLAPIAKSNGAAQRS